MYSSVTALARAEVQGTAFRVVHTSRPSSVAIVAPHGGKIEPGTSEIALAIAGADFNLYLVEGMLPERNYPRLHVTSHHFDEPRGLKLVGACDIVVAIHGCDDTHSQLLLGGRDESTKRAIGNALSDTSIDSRIDGHPFPGDEAQHICNRRRSGQGVQIELPRRFRTSLSVEAFVAAVRKVLLERDRAA